MFSTYFHTLWINRHFRCYEYGGRCCGPERLYIGIYTLAYVSLVQMKQFIPANNYNYKQEHRLAKAKKVKDFTWGERFFCIMQNLRGFLGIKSYEPSSGWNKYNLHVLQFLCAFNHHGKYPHTLQNQSSLVSVRSLFTDSFNSGLGWLNFICTQQPETWILYLSQENRPNTVLLDLPFTSFQLLSYND